MDIRDGGGRVGGGSNIIQFMINFFVFTKYHKVFQKQKNLVIHCGRDHRETKRPVLISNIIQCFFYPNFTLDILIDNLKCQYQDTGPAHAANLKMHSVRF